MTAADPGKEGQDGAVELLMPYIAVTLSKPERLTVFARLGSPRR